MSELGRMAADAGRPTPKVGLYAAPAKPPEMERYEAVGVARYVMWVPPAPRPEAEERLDHLARAVKEYRAAGS